MAKVKAKTGKVRKSATIGQKNNSKVTQSMTAREFKIWLSGVEDMQGSDWVPSPAQWIKIRNKVKCLEEPDGGIQSNVVQGCNPHKYQQNNGKDNPNTDRMGVSYPIPNPIPIPIANPSSLVPQKPTLSGNAAPVSEKPAALNGDPRTPDIDTSAGTYQSGFA